MAEVTKSGTPSLATPFPTPETIITGLLAGEAIAAGDAVYLKGSDGRIYKASGAAANEAARVLGFAAAAADAGEAVSVIRAFSGAIMGYKAMIGATPAPAGTRFYLSGTVAGGLADTASTGGTEVIAFALGDGRILVGKPSNA